MVRVPVKVPTTHTEITCVRPIQPQACCKTGLKRPLRQAVAAEKPTLPPMSYCKTLGHPN
jgi:hypothetical protein